MKVVVHNGECERARAGRCDSVEKNIGNAVLQPVGEPRLLTLGSSDDVKRCARLVDAKCTAHARYDALGIGAKG